VMYCPCGCRDIIQLNLLPDARPCWQVVFHPDDTVSLYPAVWRQEGCRSYFFVRQGRVKGRPSSSIETHLKTTQPGSRAPERAFH
jgi:hypothetical protein